MLLIRFQISESIIQLHFLNLWLAIPINFLNSVESEIENNVHTTRIHNFLSLALFNSEKKTSSYCYQRFRLNLYYEKKISICLSEFSEIICHVGEMEQKKMESKVATMIFQWHEHDNFTEKSWNQYETFMLRKIDLNIITWIIIKTKIHDD